MKIPASAAVFLSLMLTGGFLPAQQVQDSPPAELFKLREDQLTELQRVQVPVLTRYIQQLNLLRDLYTRESRAAALVATDAEIKNVQAQLDEAIRVTNRTSLLPLQLTILSAAYGTGESSKQMNITAGVRAALGAGQKSFELTPEIRAGRPDPAPGKRKDVLVDYAIDGVKKSRTFSHTTKFDFAQLQ